MVLLFAKFIAAFSAYGKPAQIGFAMAMGLVLALVPGGTLIWFLLFIPMMLIRINQAAMLGTMGVLRLMAGLYDPLTEKVGYYLNYGGYFMLVGLIIVITIRDVVRIFN